MFGINELVYRKEKSSSRFFTKYKTKYNDLPSLHDIKPRLRELTIAEKSFIPCFLSQKAVVIDVEKDGFIGKKRRYLTQETAVLETDSYYSRR